MKDQVPASVLVAVAAVTAIATLLAAIVGSLGSYWATRLAERSASAREMSARDHERQAEEARERLSFERENLLEVRRLIAELGVVDNAVLNGAVIREAAQNLDGWQLEIRHQGGRRDVILGSLLGHCACLHSDDAKNAIRRATSAIVPLFEHPDDFTQLDELLTAVSWSRTGALKAIGGELRRLFPPASPEL